MELRNYYKFTKNDINIVVDIPSGAIHVVDDVTYKILENLEENVAIEDLAKKLPQYQESEIQGALSEIEELVEKNLLFTEDVGHSLKKPSEDIVKALCLHVAHDCNMRCKYCFASSGHFGGQRKLMDIETAKKAVDFILERSGPRRNCEIDFFGGEPLMNFELIKETIAYAREKEKPLNKNIRFTLTTNGLDLTEEVQQFVNEQGMSTVLSLDGRKEVNDNMRKTVDGQGTHDEIVQNYKKFVKGRGNQNYYIRGTFTGENIDFSQDVKHIVDMGFTEVSVEPVVTSDERSYALKDEHLEKLREEYWSLADIYLDYHKKGKPFNFFHFNINLGDGPCAAKRVSGCGAGVEYLSIDPDGNIYPCHQFVGNEEFKMGDLETGLKGQHVKDEFYNSSLLEKDDCLKCWARYYCGGGCHANAHSHNNDLKKPYELGCELQKIRTECSIYIEAAKAISKHS
ncbi:thioether cross-link-forming SCIFF peptide maturase [Alkalicella caledoniensis]|uniref:Thioether cross-link-forming SCIFF peptide maturase n=1 Tax=Alkalicella caledoniensis TaxID=2731377 RepID=A0A7G9WAM5_ALKCA|nr:thioether cross-link-forming SCIFF peptide maturase [Alkalicella caledoniensis]QNO15737.1 thioether cross-link-forming SCIFF peptide maturase [Alkalicella caledoniensis]